MYGIYDTVDNCWIGDDDGPFDYAEEMLARVAAQVYDTRMKQTPGRTQAREMGPNEDQQLKDRVTPPRTIRQAFRIINNGGF